MSKVILKDDNDELIISGAFDDYMFHEEYLIINLDRVASKLGDGLIKDLKNSDGEYCDEDVISVCEIFSDNIRNHLIAKVFRYLDENW